MHTGNVIAVEIQSLPLIRTSMYRAPPRLAWLRLKVIPVMDRFVPLITAIAPPLWAAEFSVNMTSAAIEQVTPRPSKHIAPPPVLLGVSTLFLLKTEFAIPMLVSVDDCK